MTGNRLAPLRAFCSAARRRAAGWRKPNRTRTQDGTESPLRAELLSTDQMAQHGRALAGTHVINGAGTPHGLLERLDENEQILQDTCRALTIAVSAKLRIAPAGEWLLDNYHLIDEQIRTARQHLPKRYSRELPLLGAGPAQGLPRVYDIALAAIAHGDGRIDADGLGLFVAAYQHGTPLSLGELWAIPIMLRLALIENLRRVCVRLAVAREQTNQAQDWSTRMLEIAERDPKNLIVVIADMARSNPPLAGPFVAELARRLQGHGTALALPLTWVEQRLAESSLTIEQLVLAENQQQAADQVSISNSIGSLRLLGTTDWRTFVESMSLVEQVLAEDPNGVYCAMDFATRDRYRHVIERLARRCVLSEVEIAERAVALASQGVAGDGPAYRHVGYYLIDDGLEQLERAVGARRPLFRPRGRIPLLPYVGTIVALAAGYAAVLAALVDDAAVAGWGVAPFAVVAVLGASQLASALVNWLATLLVAPRSLPRMDYSHGLPADCHTLVIVPTLLSSAGNVDALIEALEVRFLGNQDAALHFGLLTDLCDAAVASLAGDALLLARAREGIERLNEKYRGHAAGDFFLFHRPRAWNEAEQVWMGYERKRGKLADLNALLRGRGRERFDTVIGDVDVLAAVEYVITLDTDTLLPRDAARQLVAAMAHPLNRPYYSADGLRVAGGYGILQPAVGASLPATWGSRYQQLHGSEPGIDPYTHSISDVYQDLFAEGSFIGKGIYDVEVFEQTFSGRFPDNRILSHDLLEGCYARCGLLSDVHLLEDYPSRYATDVKRQQRWIRGDWQVARWVLPKVPGGDGQLVANPLSALSRWKIVDNLRRSLVPAALLLLLLVGWCLTAQPGWWTAAVLAIVMLVPTLMFLVDVANKPRETGWLLHLVFALRAAGRHLAQAAFRIACLPHETALALEAILRTVWRMSVSGRQLLEWTSYAEQRQEGTGGVVATYRMMWPAPVLAVVGGLVLATAVPSALPAAVCVLLAWLAAPALAWWTSQPLVPRVVPLSDGQRMFLRVMTRRTWAFFAACVGPADNWLPPDNYQEEPGPKLAHRTSPTNLGLLLLANLSASDLGYIPLGRLLERTANTFATMARLGRHRGHFYNWYDTQSLTPLPPRYVSTVDSGNLTAYLMTLRMALAALPDQPVSGPRLFAGLADTCVILGGKVPPTMAADVWRLQQSLEASAASPPADLPAVLLALETVTRRAAATAARCTDHDADDGAAHWAAALVGQCREATDELRFLVPWLLVPGAPLAFRSHLHFAGIPSLRELVRHCESLALALAEHASSEVARDWSSAFSAALASGRERVLERLASATRLVRQAGEFATPDLSFLYDGERRLLAVGYNVDELRRDQGFYDLLASEARLTTFVGIAQGQLPQASWFALGRLLTAAGGAPVLLSWSGTMFEYLMPLLVMPSHPGTLLDQTSRSVVARQIAYGQQRGLPWGISESGYYTLDAALDYQYRAFGVPGLGLRRGLAEDAVVAPYATALALLVAPAAACANLERLAGSGLAGRYGLYEAIDYTPARVPRGHNGVVVRSFMAHHQGMILLALAQVLVGPRMQARFCAEPSFQASLLLLQERIPRALVRHTRLIERTSGDGLQDGSASRDETMRSPDTATPEVQLLSNGRYHVMVTNAGGGYSRWKNLAVTRWREDTTRDNWGSFLYLRDVASDAIWSAAHQPTLAVADSYEAVFSEGRAEFRRRDHDYETYSEIVVSPEDDIELRRTRLTNRARRRRACEVTTYAEVVLAPAMADLMQPGFGNLFVQTEIVPSRHAILCTRRPRSAAEQTPWMFHLLVVHGVEADETSFETDRMRFIGRGRSLAAPSALHGPGTLSGSAGSVLDPIVAIRCRVTLEPGQTATIDVVTGVADSRDACLALLDKYHDRHLADRVFDLAWTHGGVTLRQIDASRVDAQVYRRLAGAVIYAHGQFRAEAALLLQNQRGQPGLWGYAISGDLPIVLLKMGAIAQLDLARQVINCHAYWRLKGLAVDLVIWGEDRAGYRQQLQDAIIGLVATGTEANSIDRPGGIFVRSSEQISHEDRVLLQAVARIVLADHRGSLHEQAGRRVLGDGKVARLLATRETAREVAAAPVPPPPDVIFGNAIGGFSADGQEYVIASGRDRRTPLPWVNVLANPLFGTVVTESGMAYTWSENAHEFRLTPWSDDNIGTGGGEALYLRDEDSGIHWSPTPQPRASAQPYLTRHGFGYSVFEHTNSGIRSELWVYVDDREAVKYSVLKVHNESGRTRRLSVTGYVEWVLGDHRGKNAVHVQTEIDAASGALFARNVYNTEFSTRVAFFDVDDSSRTLTGDRGEFLGRNGSLAQPDAMTRARLSGRLGAALDPCGAIQVPFHLAAGQGREFIFRLGVGQDLAQARALAQRLRVAGSARGALARVRHYWQRTLGAVQVETPDPALDVLANGWLVYQTLACRLWARSGFHQSGGAFGFRDQLQDVMALVHADPALVREHLLRAAAHQFVAGDVQHWWHPPGGRGVRTRCSDDYLWLPLATCRYVAATGDRSVLAERVPFIDSRALAAEEESYYDQPVVTATTGSLYQHCASAVLHGLRFGEHGLPLMGSGDWNDGMNLVGIHGRGESVWLGFFLYEVLRAFAGLARLEQHTDLAERCDAHAEQLRRNIEQHGWDGAWYRRAYFDDGTPLGAAVNPECALDSIAQSWSVLSGAGAAERSAAAMEAVHSRLVLREAALVKLLDPPFDRSSLDPGYIKGYVPGVRENGGQYTHAAVWAAMAFARLGDRARAWEIVDLINPVKHALSAEGVATYKAEPYVVAADVYAVAPHVGRGGWTWYTGSAGWLYRLIVESLLGVQRRGDRLRIEPCLPVTWTTYTVRYRFHDTLYRITVVQAPAQAAGPAAQVTVDGIAQDGPDIVLVDDRQEHQVEVVVRCGE